MQIPLVAALCAVTISVSNASEVPQLKDFGALMLLAVFQYVSIVVFSARTPRGRASEKRFFARSSETANSKLKMLEAANIRPHCLATAMQERPGHTNHLHSFEWGTCMQLYEMCRHSNRCSAWACFCGGSRLQEFSSISAATANRRQAILYVWPQPSASVLGSWTMWKPRHLS